MLLYCKWVIPLPVLAKSCFISVIELHDTQFTTFHSMWLRVTAHANYGRTNECHATVTVDCLWLRLVNTLLVCLAYKDPWWLMVQQLGWQRSHECMLSPSYSRYSRLFRSGTSVRCRRSCGNGEHAPRWQDQYSPRLEALSAIREGLVQSHNVCTKWTQGTFRNVF